jgi:GR25 family glycosyltransferase involved in LPS biosynthesis
MSIKNDSFIDAIKNYKVKVINIINNKNSEINKRVKKIFVINLLEDKLKRNYIITLMKKYDINFSLVIVDKVSVQLHKSLCQNKSLISRSELGCCLSHLWCLYQMLIHKYENAIIFEDDVILHKNFVNLFLKIHDPKMNFLLLGAHDFHFANENYLNVKNGLYRPSSKIINKIYGAHANYYSIKAAKRMFEIRLSEISFFDKEYMLMFDYYKDSSFICYPNLCVANITDSTLNHKREILSDSEYQYYSKCFINFNFKNYNFIYVNLLFYITTVSETDDYESFIQKCLYYHFHDIESINVIKKRLNMDFFTIKDLFDILEYKKNIINEDNKIDNEEITEVIT